MSSALASATATSTIAPWSTAGVSPCGSVRKRLLPGALRRYSDLALARALVSKAVFHLSLRATPGFLASVRELMALTLPIPDYNTEPMAIP